MKKYIKEEERSFEMNIDHNSRSGNSQNDNYKIHEEKQRLFRSPKSFDKLLNQEYFKSQKQGIGMIAAIDTDEKRNPINVHSNYNLFSE